MKPAFYFATLLCCLSVNAVADAPYIEHSTGFFAESMPLSKCLTTGQKAFTDLGLTVPLNLYKLNQGQVCG